MSNITTKSNYKNLNYTKIIKHCLDEDKIPGRLYLTDEQWADTGMCSDEEIEGVTCVANARAHDEQHWMKDEEARLMWSESISRPIPCSECGIQIKITKKINNAHRQKINLDGFYEVLAPGSTVGKVSPTTSIIKEPKRPEVRVRNSDIAKFGTKHDRNTELGQYVDRRPTKIHDKKTLEQKINNHKHDLSRKDVRRRKMKRTRKQPNNMSVISSVRSRLSTSGNVARALKMKISKRHPKHVEAFQNRPYLTHILHFSPAEPIAAPPT